MGDFLCARPSFLSGAARTLDLGGVFDDYNQSPSPAIADILATFADWKAVGDELTEAMRANEIELERARRPG